jgi:hypothetical protein
MRSTIRITAVALFIICSISQSGLAQVGITAVPFLQINTDTRSMGLGSSTVALRGSTGGMHLNPATIGKENGIELFTPVNTGGSKPTFGSAWLNGLNSELYLQHPGAIFSIDKWAIGYQHKYINLGSQQIGVPPKYDQGPESYEYVNTFSVAYSINSNISIGAGYSFGKSSLVSGSNEERRKATFQTFDLGIYAEDTYAGNNLLFTPSVGWSLNDYGEPTGYGIGRKDPLPMLMRLGIGLRADTKERNWDRTVFSMGGYASVSKIMARLKENQTPSGVTYKAMEPWEALFKSWGSYTRFNGQRNVELSLAEQLQLQIGFEFVYLEMLSFRVGHFYEDPQNGDRSYNTYGIGLKHKYLSFDYFVIDDNDRSFLDGTSFFQVKVNVPLFFVNDTGM